MPGAEKTLKDQLLVSSIRSNHSKSPINLAVKGPMGASKGPPSPSVKKSYLPG